MTQKTNPVVVTARRAVVAAALAGGTCAHTTALAQSEEGHTISPIRLQVGEWVFVATLNAEEVVDGFVAIQPEAVDANEIDHVWFEYQENGYTKSYADGLNAGEAIGAIKAELGIPDDQDELWPVSVTSSHHPADFNDDGQIDGADLSLLLGAWGTNNATADIDGDGIVGGSDLAFILGAWGTYDPPGEPAWQEATFDVFESACSENTIITALSAGINVTHELGAYDEVVVNISSQIESCEETPQHNQGSRPVVSLENVGDVARMSPSGFSYFKTSDMPSFLATAHDEEDGDLDVEITWNGLPYIQGTAIPNEGRHYVVARSIDSDGNESIAQTSLFAVDNVIATVDPIIFSLESVPNNTGGVELFAKVRLEPTDFDASEVNCASLALVVEYVDGTESSGVAARHLRVSGMYSEDFQDIHGDTADTELIDGVLEVSFEGSIPSDDILRYRIRGAGLMFPSDSFVFDEITPVILEQGDPDSDDPPTPVRGSYGMVSCKSVLMPDPDEGSKWENVNTPPPFSGSFDDNVICTDSTWEHMHLADGVHLNAAIAKVVSLDVSESRMSSLHHGQVYRAFALCPIPSGCSCKWKLNVTASAKVWANLDFEHTSTEVGWPPMLWGWDWPFSWWAGGARAGSIIGARWEIVNGDNSHYATAEVGLAETSDIGFGISIPNLGGSGSLTVPGLRLMGPVSNTMDLVDFLEKPFIGGPDNDLVFLFRSHNAIEAAADGTCLNTLSQLQWSGRAWIEGLQSNARVQFLIDPDCAPPGAGPDNFE